MKAGELSPPDSLLVTVLDVSHMLGIGCECVRRWARCDKLPAPIKMGGKVLRWKRKEIDAWLAAHKKAT